MKEMDLMRILTVMACGLLLAGCGSSNSDVMHDTDSGSTAISSERSDPAMTNATDTRYGIECETRHWPMAAVGGRDEP